jgi:vacuolar-type H+-ATPase subunit I/STV1
MPLEMPVKRTGLKDVRVEDILSEELRREMGLEPELGTGKLRLQRVSSVSEWEDIMHSVYELPLELEGYSKPLSQVKSLKEVADILREQKFDSVKRSESRKKQLRQFTRTMNMYYNLVFTKGKEKVGYGALIYFPNLSKKDPEKSSGIVLVAKKTMRDGESDTKFERAKFEDFQIEVKPYIEMLGNLYRKSRKP